MNEEENRELNLLSEGQTEDLLNRFNTLYFWETRSKCIEDEIRDCIESSPNPNDKTVGIPNRLVKLHLEANFKIISEAKQMLDIDWLPDLTRENLENMIDMHLELVQQIYGEGI